MYCATFYSYKGGVGRTLALGNVAALLAIRGKRVLIVDFDLEAPGITTLDICVDARGKPGVVDYIHRYLRDRVAPTVADFIHTCRFKHPGREDVCELDVMPAGNQDSSYGSNFAKIDWRELYDEREGFLLMEDMRQQWANLGYDYVLIDSRTGLTDVSGICTRQLPDGVINIFFPNEQNLVGLKEMAQSIRTASARPNKPELLFVASRLPRLDDENGVLDRWLDRFKDELGYSAQQFCFLEHYDSLALLDQDIFVISRPKTGLSKQYQNLGNLLAQLNNDDAHGALSYIRTLQQIYSGRIGEHGPFLDPSNPFCFMRHADRLRKIEDVHVNDCVIQRELAEHYYHLRDFAHLEVVLRHGLAAGAATEVEGGPPADTIARLYQLQMKMATETGETGFAVDAAVYLLRSEGASERMVVEALMNLITLAPTKLPAVEDISYLRSSDSRSINSLMRKFGISSREAEYNSQIALYAARRLPDDSEGGLQSAVELALIAGGEFDEALRLLGRESDPAEFMKLGVEDAFNRAVALWGQAGSPSITLFEIVRDKTLEHEATFRESANYQQCMGLTFAILGDIPSCEEHVERAVCLMAASSGRREVSCWSFVEEPEDDFKKHCAAIKRLAHGESEVPLFIAKRALTAPRLH